MEPLETQPLMITSDSIRGKLTQILVSQPVAQAIIESWLDGKGVEVPPGMTPRIDCTFKITIVPALPSNGQVQ